MNNKEKKKREKQVSKWWNHSHTGWLIAIEGIDGSGKTTLAKELEEHFKRINVPVIRTREPYGENLRKHLKSGVETDRDHINEMLVNDRSHHYKHLIEPYLKRGYVVLVDRYVESQMVYQGRTIEEMWDIANENFTNVPMPDIDLYVSTPPSIAWDRIKERGEIDGNESIESLEQVCERYYRSPLIGYVFTRVVDGEGDMLISLEQALEPIEYRIKCRNGADNARGLKRQQ